MRNTDTRAVTAAEARRDFAPLRNSRAHVYLQQYLDRQKATLVTHSDMDTVRQLQGAAQMLSHILTLIEQEP